MDIRDFYPSSTRVEIIELGCERSLDLKCVHVVVIGIPYKESHNVQTSIPQKHDAIVSFFSLPFIIAYRLHVQMS